MKFLATTLLIALLSFLSGLYLPWWCFALAACGISALIPQKPLWAFLSGFLSLFLLWGGLAWGIDSANNSILSVKIAQLLHLGNSSLLLILVTALVGALIGGGAAITGTFMTTRKLRTPSPNTPDINLSYEEQAPVK
ncbi:MAG TPA: hypothetical protein VNS58_26360 [Puia sp.]|nr:hypothetical protein [Puia sp.]